jgi:hypothetical protein
MLSSKRSVNLSDTCPDIRAAILSLKFSPILRAMIFARLVAPSSLQLLPPCIMYLGYLLGKPINLFFTSSICQEIIVLLD